MEKKEQEFIKNITYYLIREETLKGRRQ